jgi:excisionase family DNA binding protein
MKTMGLPGPEGTDWLCTADVAKLLDMSTSGVRMLVSRGHIYAAKFGRELAFSARDVKRVAAKRPCTGRPRQGFKRG